MRLLDRMVTREFFRLFMLFVLASPVLFILGDLTDNLDTYMERGYTAGQVGLSYLYQMPLFVSWGLPVAALIATIFTVNTMTRHSEVAAAKAGGISFFRLYATLPAIGIFLTVLGLGLTELIPVGNQLRSEILGNTPSPTTMARSDFIYRDLDGRIFGIRRLDVSAGSIRGITMEREGDEPDVPSVHVFAETARYEEDAGWTLENGYLRLMAGADMERAVKFGELRTRGFTESPDQLLDQQKDPDEMGYFELGRLIQILERSGGEPRNLRVERAQKLAIPVASLVIILFGAPLANSSPRGGAAYGVGVSLGITIIYLMLFKVAGALGTSGAIQPELSAWIPNLGFAAASVYLISQVRT
ncbi:MAG TPA: LptF/LptG family permease [Longimicrobiales bacterium]|nr:LptF/LptG family permease [Longimicrobiales bacterium]